MNGKIYCDHEEEKKEQEKKEQEKKEEEKNQSDLCEKINKFLKGKI